MSKRRTVVVQLDADRSASAAAWALSVEVALVVVPAHVTAVVVRPDELRQMVRDALFKALGERGVR